MGNTENRYPIFSVLPDQAALFLKFTPRPAPDMPPRRLPVKRHGKERSRVQQHARSATRRTRQRHGNALAVLLCRACPSFGPSAVRQSESTYWRPKPIASKQVHQAAIGPLLDSGKLVGRWMRTDTKEPDAGLA
jgi:hypothetical protein